MAACPPAPPPKVQGPPALCPRGDNAACSACTVRVLAPAWACRGALRVCSAPPGESRMVTSDPPGPRPSPFLASGSGQPGVHRGWRLEQRPRPGTSPELPRGQASPVSAEAGGWSRDHGLGPALSSLAVRPARCPLRLEAGAETVPGTGLELPSGSLWTLCRDEEPDGLRAVSGDLGPSRPEWFPRRRGRGASVG